MERLNQLEFGSKKKTLFSISLLHTENFRESRGETPEGRLLFNKELNIAERKVKQYKINLSKPLPERFN